MARIHDLLKAVEEYLAATKAAVQKGPPEQREAWRNLARAYDDARRSQEFEEERTRARGTKPSSSGPL